MQHSEEWGNGKTRFRENILDKNRRLKRGGSGSVLCGESDFCLKLVCLLEKDQEDTCNSFFWSEARSVSSYTAVARNIPGCVKCPIPAQYWIHEEDPCFRDFKQEKLSKERPRSLADFGSLFDITVKQWHEIGIEPEEYWYVPEKLLKEIREEDIKCDLLLTYPIQRGDLSLKDMVSFDAQEIRLMIYQILSAILELYRCGLAHGDVKPENIMQAPSVMHLDGKPVFRRDFFLSDVGSVHSADFSSNSGTSAFFFIAVYNEWQKITDCKKWIGDDGFTPDKNCSGGELKSLLCRTLMDGYALAVTVYVLATGKIPAAQDRLPPLKKIKDKWHDEKISNACDILKDVANLTIGKMQKIVDELQKEFADREVRSCCIKTWGKEAEFKFVAKWSEQKSETVKVEYGYLADQLNFNGRINPLLRVNVQRFSRLPSWAKITPVIESYSNGNKFVHSLYYAPDDAVSGNRAVNFDNYKPYSLEYLLDNGKLTDETVDELLSFGRRIDEALAQTNHISLPYPQDIVKSDGKWVILPFFLSSFKFDEKFYVEEYFKMLCGRKNALTPKNWLAILYFDYQVGILFELLPDDMVDRIAELILSPYGVELGGFACTLGKTSRFSKYRDQIENYHKSNIHGIQRNIDNRNRRS